MKKLITTITLLIGLSSYSQTVTYAVPRITSLDSICGNTTIPIYHRGDTIRIGFRYTTFNFAGYDPYNPTGLGRLQFLAGPDNFVIKYGTDSDFQSLLNYGINCGETAVTKYIDYVIPMTTQYGSCIITSSGGSAATGMYTNQFNIIVSQSTVGIEELTKDHTMVINYYDLNGNKIENIEVNTLYIKKTLYDNGFIKSEKIVIPQ